MAAQSHSARRPYALTAAVPEVQEVTRHQWWEVLCLVKRQLHTHLPEVLSVLAQPKVKVSKSHFECLLISTICFQNHTAYFSSTF